MRIAILKTIGLAFVLGALIEGCAIGIGFIRFPEMDIVAVLLHAPALAILSLVLDQNNVTRDDAIHYIFVCQAVIWAIAAHLILLWRKGRSGFQRSLR